MAGTGRKIGSVSSKSAPSKSAREKRASSKPAPAKKAVGPSASGDANATRTRILNVAMQKFSEDGLSGSRMDEIAIATGSNKRMLYYYFGSKEGLFLAALEENYRRFREIETGFHFEDLPPLEALRALVALTVDYHAAHPEFVRLVMTENIHQGKHVRQLPNIRAINRSAIVLLEKLCARGAAEGVFNKRIDPVDLHMSITALAFYNVSNQFTFSHIYQRNLASKAVHNVRREKIIEIILRSVTPG
jgi:AcrR family transcriptional regulator